MSQKILADLDEHIRLTEQLRHQIPLLRAIAQVLIDAIEKGRTVYLAGNGGSAADAQHIAAELVGRFKQNRRALPAVALTTDTSNLLAIGNDFGFDHVFDRQVEALVRPGDVLWALSTSGTSANVIQAVRLARQRQAVIIAFTGRTGGQLKSLSEHCLCIDHETSDRIQEIHELAYHLICEIVENHFIGG
jgi:D-sedoheptulose 7-phosphate isomerase